MRSFFKKHWGSLLALIALSLLVWFGQYYIGFLESLANRLFIIFILGLFWILYYFWKELKGKKENDGIIDALENNAKEEIDYLTSRFQKVLDTLKQTDHRKRFGKNYLYEKPWYIIIGPPGCGKTTLLTNSSLNFHFKELGFDIATSGTGGTRNCDWTFTDEAVLLDTAGRYFNQDNEKKVDKLAWEGLLDLLKKHRQRRPINGVIVAFDINQLMTEYDTERGDHVNRMKLRLKELEDHLNVRLPVYCVFTKCDLIAGFRDCFDRFSPDDMGQIWGFTFPERTEKTSEGVIGLFSGKFNKLIERLNVQLLGRLQAEKGNVERREKIFNFPQQMASLKEPLNKFLTPIFTPSPFAKIEPFILRGVFFTSGTQEGSPLDVFIGGLKRRFNIIDEGPIALEENTGRSYFINDLLKQLIFQEQNLVGFDIRLERRRKLIFSGAVITAICVLSFFGIAWTTSYYENKAKIIVEPETQVETGLHQADEQIVRDDLDAYVNNDAIEPFKEKLQHRSDGKTIVIDATVPITEEIDFAAILPALNHLWNATRVYAAYEEKGEPVPWSMYWGLYQGESLHPYTQQAYHQMLDNVFLRQIMAYLHTQLAAQNEETNDNKTRKNFDRLYQLLKMYLVLREENLSHLTDNKGAIKTQLMAEMTTAWKADKPRIKSQEEPLLQAHLDRLLTRLTEAKEVNAIKPEDMGEAGEQLIDNARITLRKRDLATQLYSELSNLMKTSLTPLNLESELGPVYGVFTRRTGSDFKASVPLFYTQKGYCDYFETESTNIIENRATENWVLKTASNQVEAVQDKVGLSEKAQFKQLQTDMQKLYFEDYIELWNRFLRDLKITRLNNKDDAVAMLSNVVAPQSPLRLLLEVVAKNTTLKCGSAAEKASQDAGGLKKGLDAAANITGSNTLRKGAHITGQVQRLAPGGEKEDPASKVTREFNDLNKLVEGEENTALESLMKPFRALRELLALSDITDDEMKRFRNIKASLEGRIANLPEPVKSWMRDIIDESKRLVNHAHHILIQEQEKIKRAKLKEEKAELLAKQEDDAKKQRTQQKEARDELSTTWKEEVYALYEGTIHDLYPLAPKKKGEITLADFTVFFKPGGPIESTFKEAENQLDQQEKAVKNLREQQEKERKALDPHWKMNHLISHNGQLSPQVLDSVQKAKIIRRFFFRPNGDLSVGFKLRAYDADQMVDTVALNFYGDRYLHTFGKPPKWKKWAWPNEEGNPQVRVEFKYKDGSENTQTYEGDWAWFKLLDESELIGTENQFRLTITLGGASVIYKLKPNSRINPFNLMKSGELKSFHLSSRLFE